MRPRFDMKLKYKILLSMIAISFILFIVNIVITLRVMQGEIESEKQAMFSELTDKTLMAFTYVSDDMEYGLFELCKMEGIGGIMVLEKTYSAKSIRLAIKLNSILNSTKYIADAFFVDNEGFFYYSNNAEEVDRAYYEEVYGALFEGNTRDILWAAMPSGDLYLRRAVYNIAPYQKVAYLIAWINTGYLQSLLGMESNYGGRLCILNAQNQVIVDSDTESSTSYPLPSLMSVSLDQGGEWLLTQDAGEESLYLLRKTTVTADWSVLFIIPRNLLMETYINIERVILMIGILLLILVIILSEMFSKTLMHNMSRLIKSIKALKVGSSDAQVEVQGHDEVAVIATSFNWLLRCVINAHDTALQENMAKQQAKYELLELRYRSIQSQISPHLISNILSAISSLSIIGESKKMERLCITTSQYIRKNLAGSKRKYNTIYEEIKTLREYVEICRLIYGIPLRFELRCPKNLNRSQLPSMLLQPLVENVVVHGRLNHDKQHLLIVLSVSRSDEWLHITLQDNGCGCKPEVLKEIQRIKRENNLSNQEHIGFGISSVIRRLQLQYGQQYDFEVRTQSGGGTSLEIVIPAAELAKTDNETDVEADVELFMKSYAFPRGERKSLNVIFSRNSALSYHWQCVH